MFGNVTALEGLHVTGKYRDRSKKHTCSRHSAWYPQRVAGGQVAWESTVQIDVQAVGGCMMVQPNTLTTLSDQI